MKIWHKIDMMSSKIKMLNQNKCFFMSLGSEKGFTEKQFSGSYAKLSFYLTGIKPSLIFLFIWGVFL